MSSSHWRGRALGSLIVLLPTCGSAGAQAPAPAETNRRDTALEGINDALACVAERPGGFVNVVVHPDR
jgi:hypothetical protein